MAVFPKRPDARSAHGRNLVRLCLLRGILIVCLLLAAVLAQVFAGLALLADGGVLLAIVGLTLVNLLTILRLRRQREVRELELFLQLALDVLLVTLVLYRTGGSTNPFVSYYLVPLTIASATLRMGYTGVLTLMTLLAYTALLRFYQPFAPFADHGMMMLGSTGSMDMGPMSEGSGFNTHVFGMWLNFLLSAVLITYFVSRMSLALREQDRQLADQHERLLQKEQIVAMGALAAGAAHELGTPLATMTVLVQDLEQDLPAGSPERADVGILREQLRVCRQILAGLREQAMHPAALKSQTLAEFGEALLKKMAIIHPERHFSLRVGTQADTSIKPGLILQQVIINLLNNAAEASRQQVDVQFDIQAREFLLDIRDDGPGIDPQVAERLGQPFVSSKPDGLGIGFFLSHASINQLGGSIHLQEQAGGGTHTVLRLPLASLGGLR